MGKRLRLWKEYYSLVDHPIHLLASDESDSSPDSLEKRAKPKPTIETDYGKLVWMEDILFPWISPSFLTIKDMERSFKGDGIVMCVNDKCVPSPFSLLFYSSSTNHDFICYLFTD